MSGVGEGAAFDTGKCASRRQVPVYMKDGQRRSLPFQPVDVPEPKGCPVHNPERTDHARLLARLLRIRSGPSMAPAVSSTCASACRFRDRGGGGAAGLPSVPRGRPRRFVERLADLGHDLPLDLASKVEELPGLEARNRGIRHRVREVTGFEARRRRIIERGETLAKDPLVSPEDRKALERTPTRIKAAPDADSLDAQRLRTWERILDSAGERGCHRYFVKGYHGFVTGLERSPCKSVESNRLGVQERAVWHEMLGRDGRVRQVDEELAKLVEQREAGGGRFVSEMHPYARWRHEAERRAKEAWEVLAAPETYGPHIARVPGLEKRLRETAAAVTETVTRDAPVRKEVEAAYNVRMERERAARRREQELENSRSPARHMGAEIDYGQ
ncbi:MAG: hypothetical protein F4051_06365 [Boseongicola sp. SB0670_bin_30]|nr:hypothetical protein [Boseongicola sp. SB0670_bin_30]